MLQTVEGEILLTARNLTKEVFGEVQKELREFLKEASRLVRAGRRRPRARRKLSNP
jgi:hypothetical protein